MNGQEVEPEWCRSGSFLSFGTNVKGAGPVNLYIS